MNAIAIFAFLCGAVLAFRCKVFVLYPITGLAALVAIVLGTGAGIGFGALALGIFVCAIASQVGFLFGALVRATVIAARLATRRRQLELSKRGAQAA